MSEQSENFILEHLRAIRADMAELKSRVTGAEVAIGAMGQQIAALTTAIYGGYDRISDLQRCIERIERRLELRATE